MTNKNIVKKIVFVVSLLSTGSVVIAMHPQQPQSGPEQKPFTRLTSATSLRALQKLRTPYPPCKLGSEVLKPSPPKPSPASSSFNDDLNPSSLYATGIPWISKPVYELEDSLGLSSYSASASCVGSLNSCLKKNASGSNKSRIRFEVQNKGLEFPVTLSPESPHTPPVQCINIRNDILEEIEISNEEVREINITSESLTRLIIHAPKLIKLNLAGCINLESLDIEAQILVMVNLTDCNILQNEALMTLGRTSRYIEEIYLDGCYRVDMDGLEVLLSQHNQSSSLVIELPPTVDELEFLELIKKYQSNQNYKTHHNRIRIWGAKKSPEFDEVSKSASEKLAQRYLNQATEEKTFFVSQGKFWSDFKKLVENNMLLRTVSIADSEDQSIEFTHANVMDLDVFCCNNLRTLTINAERLETLNISECHFLENVTFDVYTTPKIIYARGCKETLINQLREDLGDTTQVDTTDLRI